MSKKIEKPRKSTRLAWSGIWDNGSLGWFVSEHIYDKRLNYPNERIKQYATAGSKIFRCRVTVELVTDKRGRPISRVVKPKVVK